MVLSKVKRRGKVPDNQIVHRVFLCFIKDQPVVRLKSNSKLKIKMSKRDKKVYLNNSIDIKS